MEFNYFNQFSVFNLNAPELNLLNNGDVSQSMPASLLGHCHPYHHGASSLLLYLLVV